MKIFHEHVTRLYKSCMKKVGLLDMCAHNDLPFLKHPNVAVTNLFGNH